MIVCDDKCHGPLQCMSTTQVFDIGEAVYCKNCGARIFHMYTRNDKIYKLFYEGINNTVFYNFGMGKVIYYNGGKRSEIENILELEFDLKLEPTDTTISKLVKRVELKINKFMNFQ